VETRIRRNIIILVVATFLVLIGMSAGWFFVLVRPQREEIAKTETQYNDLKTKAGTLDSALKAKQQAEDRVNYLKGQLAFFRGGEDDRLDKGLYRRLYFGEVENSDADIKKTALDVAWRSWMNEYHYEFGPALQSELKRAEAAAKVTLAMPAIKVDDPPQTPEDVTKKLPTNGFLKPLSATNNGSLTLQVTGTFPGVLRFLEALSRSSILMVVDKNLKLENYSPTIKTTFNITPYLIAAGPGAKLAATSAVDAAAGAAANAAGAVADAAAGPPNEPAATQRTTPEVVAKIKNPRSQAGF
jgi:hypothetical protein